MHQNNEQEGMKILSVVYEQENKKRRQGSTYRKTIKSRNRKEGEKKKKKITASSKPLPEKQSVVQLVFKFDAISEIRRIIAVLKRALYLPR